MPVPKTKNDLLGQSQDQYIRLKEFINGIPPEEQLAEFPPGTMNRNIRDVLAHLYHWHLLFLSWYTAGMKGEKPDMPAKGYTWKETKSLNREIWKTYRKHSLGEISRFLDQTHARLLKIISDHTQRELFEKRYYAWTGSTSLAIYLRANTLSHYKWAFQLIRKARK